MQFTSNDELAIGTCNYDGDKSAELLVFNISNEKLLTLPCAGHRVRTITQDPSNPNILTIGSSMDKSTAAFIGDWHKDQVDLSKDKNYHSPFVADEGQFVDSITHNQHNLAIIAATFVHFLPSYQFKQSWTLKIFDRKQQTHLKTFSWKNSSPIKCFFMQDEVLKIVSQSDLVGYWNYKTGKYEAKKKEDPADTTITFTPWAFKKDGTEKIVTEHAEVKIVRDAEAQAAERFNIPFDKVDSTLTLEQACSLINQHK